MRNTGTNFGTIFDSERFVGEGATYAFGIPQKSTGQTQVDAGLTHAISAKRDAAQNLSGPEDRNYTMYFTKANPIERPGAARTTRLADPEYGTHNPFVDRGESIFGDQEVLASFDLDIDGYTGPRSALEAGLGQSTSQSDALKYNEELLKVMKHEEDFRQNLYNRFSSNPMVRASGVIPDRMLNTAGSKTVDEFLQEMKSTYNIPNSTVDTSVNRQRRA